MHREHGGLGGGWAKGMAHRVCSPRGTFLRTGPHEVASRAAKMGVPRT